MRRNGKILISSLLLLGCCTGLTSCNDKVKKTSTREYVDFSKSNIKNPKDIKADISFWVKSGHENKAPLEKITEAFKKEYPGVNIKIVSNGSYDDLELKINRAIPAHNTPTMAMCYPDHVSSYIHSNAVLDMTSMVNDSVLGFKESDKDVDGYHYEDKSGTLVSGDETNKILKWGEDDFIKQFYEQGKQFQKNGLYTVPFAKSSECLFYNKTIFEKNDIKVPETWDDMWSLCERIKEGEFGEEIQKKTPLAYDSDANMFITFCKQLNLPYTTSTPKDGKGNILFDNPKTKNMVKDVMQKVEKGYVITKGLSGNNEHASDRFTKQDILMTIGSTAGTSYNKTENFEVGVAKCPAWNDNLKVVTQGPDICIFDETTDEQRYAAWLFYKFATNKQNSAYYATQSTGYFPVKYSSFETELYKEWLDDRKDSIYGKSAKLAFELTDSYFATPVFEGSSKARKAVDEIFGFIQNDKSNDSLDKKVDRAFDNAMKKTIL